MVSVTSHALQSADYEVYDLATSQTNSTLYGNVSAV